MELGLEHRTAAVTGASRGIGEAIARTLAREGCDVSVAARTENDLEQTRSRIERHGVEGHAVVADLSTADGVQRFVDRTLDRFGTVDILVNNVGGIGEFAPFEDLTDRDWQALFELNVMSMVRAIRGFLPAMKDQAWGRIVNISSESGTQPDPEMPHYNATKAAMKNVTKSLSKQYGEDNILVNTVSPAFVKATPVRSMIEEEAENRNLPPEEAEQELLRAFRPHIELGRAGEPQEVAEVVAFLASGKASFVTGSDYRVDGGSVASL